MLISDLLQSANLFFHGEARRQTMIVNVIRQHATGGDRLRIPANHLFRMAAFYQLRTFRLMQADGDVLPANPSLPEKPAVDAFVIIIAVRRKQEASFVGKHWVMRSTAFAGVSAGSAALFRSICWVSRLCFRFAQSASVHGITNSMTAQRLLIKQLHQNQLNTPYHSVPPSA